eukprot:m51a1_g14826 hypothetical protein (165) ;mRNA; r:670630-672710
MAQLTKTSSQERCTALAGCQWCAGTSRCADSSVRCSACLGTPFRDVCANDTSCAWCGSRALCLASGDRCPACGQLARGSCTAGCRWCQQTLSCMALSSTECTCSAKCSDSPGCHSCSTTRTCMATTVTCPSCLSFTDLCDASAVICGARLGVGCDEDNTHVQTM